MKQEQRRPILTDIELNQTLSVFNRTTRLAILLTLTLEILPKDIENLSWSEVKTASLNSQAIKILNLLPRHLHSDLVFWSVVDGKIKPLKNLASAIDIIKGEFTLAEFRNLYKNMLYIEESSKQFIRALSKEIFKRE